LLFSRTGQVTDNGLIEAFNARLRQEFLNVQLFVSLKDAQQKFAQWRQHHNPARPYSSLGDLTPNEFGEKHRNPGSFLANSLGQNAEAHNTHRIARSICHSI
tara:strand:- start:201 stop:506 length:306 start_codon:yes stop_codon:yes gene_type:complete